MCACTDKKSFQSADAIFFLMSGWAFVVVAQDVAAAVVAVVLFYEIYSIIVILLLYLQVLKQFHISTLDGRREAPRSIFSTGISLCESSQ